MTIRKTTLRVQELEGRDVPSSTLLGAADNYNVMVFGNFNSYNSDTQGAMAVGGNACLSGYSVGASLPNCAFGVSLAVNGCLTASNGQVAHGSAEIGGNANISNSFGIENGQLLHGQYINFSSAQSQLDSISSGFASISANGKVTDYYGGLTLCGTSSGTNYFSLTAAELACCTGITINVPKCSEVIINVCGTSVSMSNFGINLNGISESNVIWNFYQAKTLNISGIGIPGNVLAPYAAVAFNNGQINGTFVAASMCGNGQFNWIPPSCSPDCLAGTVFESCVPDGGVTVTLSGTTSSGQKITETTTTDAAGQYDFWYVPVGTYTVSIGTPKGTTVTSLAGWAGGTASGASISGIYLGNYYEANGYNFEITP